MITQIVLPAYPPSQNLQRMQESIQIAIIEDLKDVAWTLKELFNLEEDLVCKQVYHDAESAIAFLSQHPVDIVLCDIGLPGKSGIEAIETLSTKWPKMTFCMFTVFEDAEKIFSSLKAGAKGYILKHSQPSKIVSAVRELVNGGSPMSPEIARKVIDAFTQYAIPIQPREDLGLTPREEELLTLLSKGLLYKEIGDQMGITVGTVKQHIHKIYKKLHVNNRTEALNKFNQQ